MAIQRNSVLLVLLVCASASAQRIEDVLFLQDGRERVGRLVKMDDQEVQFEVNADGGVQTYPLADVQRVELAAIRVGDEVRQVGDLKDPLLDRVLKVSPVTFYFPDSGHVTMYHLLERRLHKDGSCTTRERVVQKVLLERGKSLANVVRYFRKGDETLEVDFARTIDPDGSVTPITEMAIDVTSVNVDTPEYDKQQQLKFAMKRVVEGSVLDYQITERKKQTSLLDPFVVSSYFRDTEPIIEKELRVIVPRGRKLIYSLRQARHVKVTTTETDDEISYSFVVKSIPRVVPETQMPPWADCIPRVLAAEQTTWGEIGEAYRAAVLASGGVTPAIKAKVRELTAGAANKEEIVSSIYYYVTQSVRQVWVSPSAFRYAPRPIGEVFDKGAGNTTDKVALLRSMLVEAEVNADIALCRPRGYGKLVEEIPSIRQLDDALVVVSLESGRLFLAVDDETVRLGQLPSEYQGTRALLVTARDAHLIDIPLFAPDDECVASTFRMEMSASGDLRVAVTERPSGNYEMGYRAAWKDTKDADLRKQLEMALADMHATARLEDYDIRNLHDVTKPLVFSQTYTLEDYALGNEDLLVFRIPVLDYSAAAVGKPFRVFPLAWDQQSKSTLDLTLTIPKGYRVYYAGKNFEAESAPTTFVAKFEHAGNTITYHDEFVQRLVEAPADAYKGYKACLETMARVPKEWIVLERMSENQ